MEANTSSKLIIDENIIVKSYNNKNAEIPLAEVIGAVLESKEVEHVEAEVMEEEVTPELEFNVGDYVRCTYDDGIDYEAKILSINPVKQTCRIKYIGYENEQTVQKDALIASWGEEARNLQFSAAKPEKSVKEGGKKPKAQRGFNPPPVPPIPPMLFDSDDEEKNEQFAQLLISWFMTGYYTGLHQRNMQESKQGKK